MNYKKLAIIAALSAASSGVLAGGFDGPFVQAGIGGAHSRTDIRFTGWFDANESDSTVNGQIAGGYSKSFGQFNLAGSAFYLLGDQRAGEKTIQDSNGLHKISMKLKNTWGISIQPGYNFTPSTLGYLKFGYTQTRGDWTYVNHASGESTFDGVSYGIGAKHQLAQNLYGYAEIQQTNFNRNKVHMTVDGNHYTDSFKPESLTGFVGIGYQF